LQTGYTKMAASYFTTPFNGALMQSATASNDTENESSDDESKEMDYKDLFNQAPPVAIVVASTNTVAKNITKKITKNITKTVTKTVTKEGDKTTTETITTYKAQRVCHMD